ncbi:MAG: 50S ribosomal protein L32 [Patescibacteria group bacterium]|nr:50S ribosomal protein L32 [Patescibacteria group bacterium]
MAVPKKRHSKSKVGRRRLHIFLEKPNLVKCPKCGRFTLPHVVCPYCGYYKGLEMIDVLGKLDKKERKKREKELKMKEAEGKEVKKAKPLNWKELSKK